MASSRSSGRRDPVRNAALAHAAAATAGTLVIWAAAQPIFTDDFWWHLAFGRSFWRHGPWLAADPLLFAPAGVPSPAAWLFDLGLFGVASLGDFNALRALHAALVALILALVWSLARRASRSAAVASAATVAFIALSAYRLFQLRPDLVTILAVLTLYRLLIEHARPPSARRIAIAGVIGAAWANLHAAFVLGPLLLASAAVGTTLSALLRAERDGSARARATRLAVATAIVTSASLANPLGVSAHLAYFRAGDSTPALAIVTDEWARFSLWSLPTPTLPPTLLAWVVVWWLLVAVMSVLVAGLRGWRRIDPGLAAVALAGLALLLTAVRFLWLGIFPLLFLASSWRDRARDARWGAAAVLLMTSFVRVGDWPLISRALPSTCSDYAKSYPAAKYFAHSIWFLRDAGLSGSLYNESFLGGFAGFWLAPDVRTMVNGTLNVSTNTLIAHDAIARRRGVEPGESFTELLDRLGLDLFLGIRPPETGHPFRPWTATMAHLDATPGWIPIFRSLASAVYLRDGDRSRGNLARVARYFAAQRVPFDPATGFDVTTVIREAPDWAIAHGVVPRDFRELEQAVRIRPRSPANDRLATLYAVLGLYERAADLDRTTLRVEPAASRARRRLVWSLLRMRRFEEAEKIAAPLAQQPIADGLSHEIAKTARAIRGMEGSDADATIARLPFLYREEVGALFANTVEPEARRFSTADLPPG